MTDIRTFSQALREDFEIFARKVFRELNEADEIGEDPYLTILWHRLERVAKGKTRRLLVNMPPRHLKTLSGVALAAWELGHNPGARIIIVSYGEDLAADIADFIRTILKAPWYQKAFPRTRIGNRDTATHVKTTAGGALYATSFAGNITGKGADLIIVDDPHKIADAAYPDQMTRTVGIFSTSVVSRLNSRKRGRIVVFAHRLSPHDLSGHLLEEGGWKHLKLPLIVDEETLYMAGPYSWLRKAGELLRNGEFDEAEIDSLRRSKSIPDFETFYQQNPPDAAELIVAEDFGRFDKSPAGGRTILSVDWATGETAASSYSVVQVWRVVDGQFYLINVWRSRAPYEYLKRQIWTFAERYRCSVILIENGTLAPALQAELIQTFGRAAPKIELVPTGNQSKQERLGQVTDLIKEGRVYIPQKADWIDAFLEELTTFPGSDNDDQVDALSQALKWLRENRNVPPPPQKFLGCIGRAVRFNPPGTGYTFHRR